MRRMSGWQVAAVVASSLFAWLALLSFIGAATDDGEDAPDEPIVVVDEPSPFSPPALPTDAPSTTTPRETATPEQPAYDLALISASCAPSASGSYAECQGFVQNISDEPLDQIQVVIEWVDAAGVPQASETGFVDYSPLQPGQQSPWSTFGTLYDLPQYRVQFKELFGGTIATRDDRP